MSGSGSDPLASLVSSFSFTNVTSDMVTVGVAVSLLLVAWVGIKFLFKIGTAK